MSYSASISRHPIARRTFPAMAVCLHVAVLWLLVSARFVHLQPPSLPPSVEVSLVFAPAPAPPTPVEPTPEPPAPVEPTPEPIPEPKLPDPPPVVIPDPVVIPTPIKVPPPKPVVVKPLPQPVRQPDPPKPIPKPPEPKKSKINSAEDIRRRNDFRQPTAARPVPVDPNKLKNSLLAAADSVRVPSRPTSPSTSAASAAQERDYESAVTAAMRIHWSEDFNAGELNGPGRAALVRFVIRADGSIVSARIVRRSGVMAIDSRAARAIQAVRSFPAPKDYGIRSATYDVEFELTAKD